MNWYMTVQGLIFNTYFFHYQPPYVGYSVFFLDRHFKSFHAKKKNCEGSFQIFFRKQMKRELYVGPFISLQRNKPSTAQAVKGFV